MNNLRKFVQFFSTNCSFLINFVIKELILNMKLHYLLPFVILFHALSIQAQTHLNFKNNAAATVGIYVQDLKTGKVIANQNANVAMTPASVTKSITVAGAMLHLNSDFSYRTNVYLVGETISHNNSINANIVVSSSSDPTLESEHFPKNKIFVEKIVENILAIGVDSINGEIIVVPTRQVEDYSNSWMVEDVAWDYGAGYRNFNYKDNKFIITYNVDSATFVINEDIPNLDLSIDITPAQTSNIILTRGLGSTSLSVSGNYNQNRHEVKMSCSLPSSQDLFKTDLISRLKEKGIYITATKLQIEKNDTLLLYSHNSPTRDEIMRSLMVRSDNMFADAIMQSIAPTGAIDSLVSTLKKAGIKCNCISLADGCGLSRVDRLTPKFIADVYRLMYKSQYKKAYLATFPLSGKDGTMANFCKGTKLEGKLAMKTGSMGGVQCYGGYKLDENNEPTHSVVIMVNNFFCERYLLRKAIQDFLLKIF